jgi:glycosyltransferase involved in cell wall biosynthesis
MQKVNFEYEIVIGDDCSTDNTQEILLTYQKKYPDIFVLVLREQNIGPTLNAYDIWKRAKGKYIANLEGDDFWNVEYKLQMQVDFLEKHSEYIAIAHKNFRCDEFGMLINDYPWPIAEGDLTINDFIVYGFLYHSSTVMHRNIFLDSGDKYKDILTSHPLVGDRVMSLLLLDNDKIYLHKGKYSTYRCVKKVGATNAQSLAKSNLMKSMTEQLQQTQLIEDYFHGKYDFTEKKASQVAFLWLTFLPFFTNTTKESKIKARKLLKKIDYKNKLKTFLFYFKKIWSLLLRKKVNHAK